MPYGYTRLGRDGMRDRLSPRLPQLPRIQSHADGRSSALACYRSASRENGGGRLPAVVSTPRRALPQRSDLTRRMQRRPLTGSIRFRSLLRSLGASDLSICRDFACNGLVYETRGHRFESCRARPKNPASEEGDPLRRRPPSHPRDGRGRAARRGRAALGCTHCRPTAGRKMTRRGRTERPPRKEIRDGQGDRYYTGDRGRRHRLGR
jgi:hypothetical protein